MRSKVLGLVPRIALTPALSRSEREKTTARGDHEKTTACADREASRSTAWFLFAGIVCACLPHISYQPLSVFVISVLCLGWRFGVLLKRLPGMPKFLQLLLAAAALGMILHGENYNLGRDSGISLLVAALAIKQIQNQDELNFYFSVCLTYFVAAAAFLYDQSLSTFFLIGHAVVFVTLALYTKTAVSTTHTDYRTVARLLFVATPLTLVLFFLVPDFQGPLWEMPSDAYEAHTGLSNEMSPGKISSLVDSTEVVFRVKFDTMPQNKAFFIDSLYWRGPVFGYFDGQSWQSLSETLSTPWMQPAGSSAEAMGQAGFYKTAGDRSGPAAGNEYHITLEPHYNHWLFTLSTPSDVREDFYLTGDEELVSRDIVNQPLQYTLKVNSARNNVAPDQRYLRLPNMYGYKTKLLVNKLRQDLDPRMPYDTQMVTKVLEYFREQPFYYSKKPPLAKYDPVDEFIFKTKTGFCEHYASAFAFMMRAAGVPSRVVTGYMGGEYNGVGDYIIVRQSAAHAWTEVWLQGKGWVRVDPTAVIPAHRTDTSGSQNPYVMAGLLGWDRTALAPIAHWLDTISYRWYGFLATVLQARNQNWLSWMFTAKHYALITALLILCAWLVLRVLRRGAAAVDPVARAYENFCRKLARLGLDRLPHENAGGYAQRVCAERPDLQAGVQAITQLYNQLRYGRDPGESACKQLCREVARFRPARAAGRFSRNHEASVGAKNFSLLRSWTKLQP